MKTTAAWRAHRAEYMRQYQQLPEPECMRQERLAAARATYRLWRDAFHALGLTSKGKPRRVGLRHRWGLSNKNHTEYMRQWRALKKK